jgi:hypothetical protein
MPPTSPLKKLGLILANTPEGQKFLNSIDSAASGASDVSNTGQNDVPIDASTINETEKDAGISNTEKRNIDRDDKNEGANSSVANDALDDGPLFIEENGMGHGPEDNMGDTDNLALRHFESEDKGSSSYDESNSALRHFESEDSGSSSNFDGGKEDGESQSIDKSEISSMYHNMMNPVSNSNTLSAGHSRQQEPIEFASNLRLFETSRDAPPIEISVQKRSGDVMTGNQDTKKRKTGGDQRYKAKAASQQNHENTLGAPKPFPRGTLSTKEWKMFFALMKKFESENQIDCKRLWIYKRYDDVYQIIHLILIEMMLHKTKNQDHLAETDIVNFRNVFGIWYRAAFTEKGPFKRIVKGTRKGKGWLFSDEEVDAIDIGMYMYPADTTQNRFSHILHDSLCGPVFQNTRTPFQLYDKARSLNVERPWEQLCMFYELQDKLTKATLLGFEKRNMNKKEIK